MKYYNFETMFFSLAEKLRDFLDACADVFDYEISKAGAYYHFEILTDHDGADAINDFLNNNTVWCAGVK